ncbi:MULTISPECIES: MFS transporter [unclassified Bacillus (in: firmicutes)]|uniref:MDR family MFS transporter n=1 Tax=unclassified Bacillus (in: firmicutes) TaxID=185979 RepID=UPI0008EF3A22|nr:MULTISPECIES: MFS transporter [unclassified Bacillus (in: firmicutes)]SFJ78091.1 MFS transporter, DHA1 family, multidrug resistance protein B [Bacillus sp. 71mf]SFS98832.1 MFS transporter, DHA1 family, multidrug resistance protein B [Bacillus sp. 103mf]
MGFWSMHRNIKIRIITSFLTRTVGTMIFPFMAIYFSIKLGAVLAGFLLLLNVIASLIVGLYGGYIADTLGRKKVMIIGQVIQVISIACMGVVNSDYIDSAWLTFVFLLINSIGSGVMNPATEAMLIDVSTPENRKMMYSINYWAINLSIAIGAIFGGLLFEHYRFQLFILLTGIALLTLYLITVYMEEVYVVQKKVEKQNVLKDMMNNYRVVMKDRAFIVLCLGSICALSLEFQINNYIGVRLQKEFETITFSLWNGNSFDLTGIRMLSWISTENTVLVVLFSALIVKIMNHFEDRKVLYTGLFIYTIGFTIFGASNSLWILLLAGLFQTIGEMMYVPVSQSIRADMARDDARSSYMAINGMVFQIAKMVGTLGIMIGSVIASWGMSILYCFIGISSIFLFKKAVDMYHRQGEKVEKIG